ncbi:hypothetical protein TNCV_4017501 [Trichonephila clavipes]|nr:hypothetical protein TNCV_4017501 [Trichonephila clavipes]
MLRDPQKFPQRILIRGPLRTSYASGYNAAYGQQPDCFFVLTTRHLQQCPRYSVMEYRHLAMNGRKSSVLTKPVFWSTILIFENLGRKETLTPWFAIFQIQGLSRPPKVVRNATIEHSLMSERYINILAADLVYSFMATMFPVGDNVYRQDNALCHKCRFVSEEWLEEDFYEFQNICGKIGSRFDQGGIEI